MMKNVFYFTSKALFVLEIFTFLSWLFSYLEKRLDKKTIINFIIYDVTDWTKEIITIRILPNLSRSKDDQAMKFGQLIIKYSVKNKFPSKNNVENVAGRLVPDLFFVFQKNFV